jgi:drug/metabolite transporter (DMT)-like permease
MGERLLAAALVVGLSAVGVFADILIKYGADRPEPFVNRIFYAGSVIYGLTAVGWVVALQHLKLATVGVIYGVSTVLLLALGGWALFEETLRPVEWIAVAMGTISIVLLWRFA